MTDSDVFFDSWAWWEVLHETATGKRLDARYGPGSGSRVHTSVLSLAELGSKFVRTGDSVRLGRFLTALETDSKLHPVTEADARSAANLHPELRRKSEGAGVADALILSASRRLGCVLISGDRAFKGMTDVRAV